MSEAQRQIKSDAAGQSPRVTIADMAPLIKRVREFQEIRKERSIVYQAPDDLNAFARRFGFAARGKGTPEVVLAEDVAVELGHPSTSSQSFVLVTFQKDILHHGCITLIGADVDEMKKGEHRPLAQIVMAAFQQGAQPDPFDLENLQYLTHRLPGYMVRSVPGHLWVRISNKGKALGLSMRVIGSALICAYTEEFEELEALEVLFVTSGERDIDELTPLATEAKILAGRHKKLILTADGEVECSDLDCERCEEKPVCDTLKDVVIKRRGAKNA